MRGRGTWIVAVTLVASVSLWIWVAGDADRGGEGASTTTLAREPAREMRPVRPVIPPAEMELEDTAPEMREVEPTPADRVAVELAPSDDPVSDYPESRLFGRALDVRGGPIAGVEVGLSSVGEDFVDPALVPDPSAWTYSTVTAPDGRFELTVPLPTSNWVSLGLDPGPYHGRAGREFGLAGGRNQEPVARGDNDLGDFVLPDAGVIAGRIFAEDGGVPTRASARLDGSYPGGYSLNGKSDSDGFYRIEHVPAGVYDVEALSKGYITANRRAITVRNGEVTHGIDLTLSTAPSISGRVVDEDGEPLAKARLWGWPQGSGQGAGGRSADDGTFRISLPQNEPYTLEVTLSGYAKHDPGRDVVHAPGTDDIVVVLRRPLLATFRVRTAEGAPVERFGLKIIQTRTPSGGTTNSSSHREPAAVADHADGTVSKQADPALHEYTIVAPGFAPRRGAVEFDDAELREQTITLKRGATVTGRFVFGGEPVAATTVRLERDRYPKDPADEGTEEDWFSNDWTTDVDRFAGRLRIANAEADGSFRFDDLAGGTYELTLNGTGVAPRVLERLRVPAGEVFDVGDVEASAPASLSGVVVLLPIVSPAGITVSVGDEWWGNDEREQVLGTDGRFRFEGLPPGKHYIHVDDKEGVVESSKHPFDLVLGEEREVVLDLRDGVPFRVDVVVTLGGVAANGVKVEWISRRVGSSHRRPLGRTNDRGEVSGFVRSGDEVWIEAVSHGGLKLAGLPAALTPEPGEVIALTLEGPASGELSVALPAELDPADHQFLRIVVAPILADGSDGPGLAKTVRSSDWKVVDGANVYDLGRAAPGAYRAQIQIGMDARYMGEATVVAGGPERIHLALQP